MTLVEAFLLVASDSEPQFRAAVKNSGGIPRRHPHYRGLLLVLKWQGKVRYGRRVARTVEQLDTIITEREA